MQTAIRNRPIKLKPAYSPKPNASNLRRIRAQDDSPSPQPVSPKGMLMERLNRVRSLA
jgi:hypothetical protein